MSRSPARRKHHEHDCEAHGGAERDDVAEQPPALNPVDEHEGNSGERNRHRDPGHRPHALAQHDPPENRGDERGGADDEERVRDRGQQQREHVARRSETETQGHDEAGPSRCDECMDEASAIANREIEGHDDEERQRTVEENLPAARRFDVPQGDPREAEQHSGGEHQSDARPMASIIATRRRGACVVRWGQPGTLDGMEAACARRSAREAIVSLLGDSSRHRCGSRPRCGAGQVHAAVRRFRATRVALDQASRFTTAS